MRFLFVFFELLCTHLTTQSLALAKQSVANASPLALADHNLPQGKQKPLPKPDVDLLKSITECTNIPVIASGGVGILDHLYDGIVKGGASAVLAASIFHYGEFKIKEAKEYLKSKNVSVRL